MIAGDVFTRTMGKRVCSQWPTNLNWRPQQFMFKENTTLRRVDQFILMVSQSAGPAGEMWWIGGELHTHRRHNVRCTIFVPQVHLFTFFRGERFCWNCMHGTRKWTYFPLKVKASLVKYLWFWIVISNNFLKSCIRSKVNVFLFHRTKKWLHRFLWVEREKIFGHQK